MSAPDGKTASLGYTPDVINLDISDPTNPKLIGKLHITEPFASVGMQSVHTVLPLWDLQPPLRQLRSAEGKMRRQRLELRRHNRQR